ncbi:MAG TPA: hypothetical protein VL003_13245 [Pusillimonas sp.]|uniref:hypothetical protein n=1 Tax=Pusillimonas sp. TaxID=3040095 RepID=UPI002D083CC3|nr:hypothetical protein [Pusillimonas sp.]HUH88997.1 hypothetical protein [Pusillimonas sp.]
MNHSRIALMIVTLGIGLTACTGPASVSRGEGPASETMSFDQLAQTDFNRTVTIAMRDNLNSLTRLLEKLYRRNPSEWRKTGAADIDAAILAGRMAIESGHPPPGLQGLRDIQILSVALDPQYQGDRVAAFVLGLSDMIVQAHGGKIRFYASDMLEATHVYNAARNVEAAAWLLASRRNQHGQPLLLANEISNESTNLSFEREFGQLIGRLDLVANLLDENIRRVGINYMQGLLFFNFLPVR